KPNSRNRRCAAFRMAARFSVLLGRPGPGGIFFICVWTARNPFMYYTVQFNYWPIAMTRLWVRNTARGILAAAMLAGCSSEQVAQERPRPAMVAHPEPAQPA